MKRIKSRIGRYLLGAVTALALLLCAATVVLWVRSYFLTDQLIWRSASSIRIFQSARGHIVLTQDRGNWGFNPSDVNTLRYSREPPASPENAGQVQQMYVLNVDPGDRYVAWNRGGFGWFFWEPPDKRVTLMTAVAPFWSAALLTGLLPLWWAASRWRARAHHRRRQRLGLCPICGYDLCATPGRCPECGTIPQP